MSLKTELQCLCPTAWVMCCIVRREIRLYLAGPHSSQPRIIILLDTQLFYFNNFNEEYVTLPQYKEITVDSCNLRMLLRSSSQETVIDYLRRKRSHGLYDYFLSSCVRLCPRVIVVALIIVYTYRPQQL